MKGVSILVAILFLFTVCVGVAGAQAVKIYGENWELVGYLRKGAFTNQYYVYDKNWKVKGYIKWNSFSERYEIYDKDWSKRGYLKSDEGVLPFLKGAND